ncbi:hypothetical protein QVD17_33883 [Tagetes erecta]|uniref:FAF domain-containing protein n=1 Tax=Tagetes erecta TaxID=13708 RepID=A0AAD8K3N3_TARER|nr:hypothetical protein QVD17_33883 [Tagetes erecta]
MSTSTADDSHSPPADVHQSTIAFKICNDDDQTEEECSNQKKENVRERSVRQDFNNSMQNPVKLPETELLGFENENVKSGVTDVTAEFTVMSSITSPSAVVHRSTVSFNIGNDNCNEEEYGDQNNENVRERQDKFDALQNPVTLLETDNLGFENETGEEYVDQSNENVRECSVRQNFNNALRNPAKTPEIDILGLENDVTTKSKSNQVSISSNRIEIEEDEHEHEEEVIYDFPPGLSTLNVNGRPKFELVTVRENGRLQMFMVPNLSPQLVRSPGRNGRLKMWLLNDDQHAGDKALPPVRRSI